MHSLIVIEFNDDLIDLINSLICSFIPDCHINTVVIKKCLLASHLLVRHHAVGLQGSWMSTEQNSSRPVMFTEDGPINVVKAISRDQAVPAGRTGKTLRKKEKQFHVLLFISKLLSR